MASKILQIRTTLHCLLSRPMPIITHQNARLRFLFTKSNSPNLSLHRKRISVANLFQRYGFPLSQLHSFISMNRFLLNSNFHDIEKSLGILLSFKILQKSAVSLIPECLEVLEAEFLKKWEIGFSKYGNLCVSPLMIKSILGHSRRFAIDPGLFNKSMDILNGLGFSEGTVRKVLEGFPEVVAMKQCLVITWKMQVFPFISALMLHLLGTNLWEK